ncbi:hypothetical protein VTN96DRAFT_4472 [Rasamsonia emersonii]
MTDSTPSLHQLRNSSTLEKPPLSAQKLFDEICAAVVNATNSQELVYKGIHPSIGSLVADSLAAEPRIERTFPRIH